jgi:hypothetical protein
MTLETRTKWQSTVRRWRASGLTAPEFASRERLNVSTLRWWSSRLSQPENAAGFVEVQLPTMPATPTLTIVLRDGLRIEVSESFDADLLRRVVAALEER